MSESVEYFMEAIAGLNGRGFLKETEDIIFKNHKQFIALDSGCNLKKPEISSLVMWENDKNRAVTPRISLLEELLLMKKEYSVVLLSKQPFTLGFSRTGKTLFPLLDDIAQIAGTKIKSIANETDLKKVKFANTIFIKDKGCLCFGKDLYEIEATAMVVEKAVRAEIDSFYLGGGKRIAFHEALLMRLLYKSKYSKMKEE